MTKLLLVVTVILLLTLSGCISKDAVYVCDTGSVLYLHSDGTYHIDSVGSYDMHGNYTIVEDGIFIDLAFGISDKLQENGTNYVDAEGDNWVVR